MGPEGGRLPTAPDPPPAAAAPDLIRAPTGVLAAPGLRDLPEPVPLRRMVGPSVILAGLSIGSGEFVLWPRLTAEYGFALFWACWIGVTLQFFLNMEIERYSLATGESAVVGFVRLSRRIFGPVFLVCATLPWIWPGWATGAATLLHWEIGLPITATAVAGLTAAVSESLAGARGVPHGGGDPDRARRRHHRPAARARGDGRARDSLLALLAGAVRFGHVPDGIHLPHAARGPGLRRRRRLGANLAQSNYIKDKGYGMGRWIGRITSPFTGREEAASDVGFVFVHERRESGALARVVAAHERRALRVVLRAVSASRSHSSACWRRSCSSRVQP